MPKTFVPISRFKPFLAVALGGLLAGGVAPAENQLTSVTPLKAKKNQRLERGRQLAHSLDLGDSFRTPKGKRALRRLMGGVAIQLADLTMRDRVMEELTGPGKPLAGYSVDERRGMGVIVLQATAAETDRQRREPALHAQAISAVRAVKGVRSVRPVFVEPVTGLSLIPNGDLLVRLRPETDPQAYFGADWSAVRRLPGTQYHFVLPRPEVTAEELFAEVNQRMADPRVRWIEPDFVMEVVKRFTPNDPLYPSQWHWNNTGQGGGAVNADVNAPQAWDITTGSSNVVIAIIDDGIQLNHPDLAPNIFVNPNELANGVDDDGNGYRDDVRGWDFVGNDNDASPADPEDSHGTATSGVAAARGNNGVGVAGMAYTCRILPVKVITGATTSSSILMQAIRYAGGVNDAGVKTWRGADVLSISLTFSSSVALDDALSDVATNGRDGKGCPIFCAAGNDAAGWTEFIYGGIPSGTHTFRWDYFKDNSAFDGDDTVWLDSVVFPGGAIERFESGALPSGWTSTGAALWTSVQDGVSGNHALTGWSGPASRALRAGRIFDNQTSSARVIRTVSSGEIHFWAWVSTELDFDFLDFYVDTTLVDSISGVPFINTLVDYPANHPLTIAVGASTDFDYRADYSQYGTDLDFVAPSSGAAGHIYTTDRTGIDGFNPAGGTAGDYQSFFGGTSASTPLAAGIGALVLSVNSSLTAAEVRDILRKTCDRVGGVGYVNGRNQFYGYGRVNAAAALAQARVDIAVTQMVSPATVPAGSNLTFTTAVTNKNLATAKAVTLADALPSNLSFVSASASQGNCTNVGGMLTCNLGNITSGITATVTLVAKGMIDGSITNSTTVTASEPDAVASDNTAIAFATITAAANFALTANASPDPTVWGGNTTFMLTVTNPGPSTAMAVTVTDTLPGGVGFVSATVSQGSAAFSNGIVTGDFGALIAGANATLSVVVTPNRTGTFTNQATVTTTVADPDLADNSVTTVATVISRPGLTVSSSPDQVVFSWSTSATGFALEYTDTLAPPINWAPATNDVVVAGEWFTVTVDAPSGNRFYRLKR
jgi:uncharacterized repeat protein (TIGR01451 family)